MTVLKNFSISLYASEASVDSSEVKAFLDKINIPKIDPEVQSNLEAIVTFQEVIQAINSMRSGFP